MLLTFSFQAEIKGGLVFTASKHLLDDSPRTFRQFRYVSISNQENTVTLAMPYVYYRLSKPPSKTETNNRKQSVGWCREEKEKRARVYVFGCDGGGEELWLGGKNSGWPIAGRRGGEYDESWIFTHISFFG